MKNIVASIAAIVFLSVVVNAHAVTRNVQADVENQSVFGKLVATGSDQTGNPGYIGLVAQDTLGANNTYYLWINTSGTLCVSSYPTIRTYSSFPNGDWRTGMPCTVVGGQS